MIGIRNHGFATMTATVNSNVIVANNTVASNGIGGGNGVVLGCAASRCENPKLTLTAMNNSISQTDGNGILLVGPEARSEQEQDRRGEHREHVHRRRAPDRAAQVMESQSTNPVSAVGTVTTRPTISASYHAVVVLCSETPSALRSPTLSPPCRPRSSRP